MPTWTPEQQQAIDARNHTILVSAAAGSGKTAVLIERIVQLLREGASLDRMLIVTFTKAAAGEMRQRLAKRLTHEAQLYPEAMGQALDELEACEISTIHAFCTKLLRNQFQFVGIDPMFRICEENDRQALFELAFCDAMNDLLENEAEPDFLSFADAYDQAKIRDMTGALYTFLMSMPSPFDWLDTMIRRVTQKPYSEHPWQNILMKEAARQIDGMAGLLEQQRRMFDQPDAVPQLMETWQADMMAYESILRARDQSEKDFYEHMASFEFVKAVTCRGLSPDQKIWQKEYNRLRTSMKDLIRELVRYMTVDEARCDLEFPVMQQHLRGLQTLIEHVHAAFLAYKQQKNVVDFSDLELFTCQILQDEAQRSSLQAEFDHIFVDECQDVSAIQDEIIQAIHGSDSCLFMVGDVKQSIYRFRLADPTRFLHRMRTFSDDENAVERRIFLQKNFRSRTAVLDATNRVFRHLMRKNVTELDYLPEDELIPGRGTEQDPPVEMIVIDAEGDEEEEKLPSIDAEAAVLVEKIRELLHTAFPGDDSGRFYTYRDMVILLPKTAGVGGRLVELMGLAGIPVFFDGADSYFSLPEIMTVKALLMVIDNPMQDVALLASLKTIPFCLRDEDLAAIRLRKTGKSIPFHEAFDVCCEEDSPLGRRCAEIRDQLEDWRFQAQVMRLSDFVWKVMQESGYYASCGALPKGDLRQANLRLLRQRAAEYEDNGGNTLSGFLELADQQQDADDKRSAKTLGESENLVRIMTMHKSKGLEFPVVFCLQTSGRLHKSSTTGILMHNQLGVALPYVNRKLNIRRATMAEDAFTIQRKLDEKAERARLLYVAMTRAREKLYIIGCTPEKKRWTWHMPESDYRIFKADSMTDWLMQAMLTEEKSVLSTSNPQGENPWKITLCGRMSRPGVDKIEVIHNAISYVQAAVSRPSVDELWTTWQQDAQLLSTAPMKTSVSALAKKVTLHDPLPIVDEEETPDEKRREENIVSPLRLSELPAAPAFLEEKKVTGAERGTMVHRLLSLLPLEALRQAEEAAYERIIHEELHRMVSLGQVTAQELMVLPVNRITSFFRSELGKRMLRSPSVRREWSFNLLLQEGSMLQGVIDCAFMEGDSWVLMDYKTDRIEDEAAFVERYQLQLNWYARALEEITGCPVKEMRLVSLTKGVSYSVDRA